MWQLKLWSSVWIIRDTSPAWGETGTWEDSLFMYLAPHCISVHICWVYSTRPQRLKGAWRTSSHFSLCIFSSSFLSIPDCHSFLRSLVKLAVNQIMPLCNNLERRSRWRWKKRRGAETGCSNVRMVAALHGWMMDYLQVRHEKVC